MDESEETSMNQGSDGSDMIGIEAFREQARTWLEANLERRRPGEAPRIRGTDHKTVEGIRAEREIQRALFEAGYAGIAYPKEYGGSGLTLAHETAFSEEAKDFRMPDLGIAGGTTFGVCARTMLAHASPEFLARHIPKILAGDELWVQFFSEPEAGSDLAGIRTRAVRDGDRWILNGAKIWSSGAYYADYGMCLARTNAEVPKHRGLTWFAVPTTAKGVTVQPIVEINGDAEFCQEFFDDVELSDEDVIGEVDQGWRVAQTMLVFERGAGRGVPKTPADLPLAPDLVALAQRLGRHRDPAVRQMIATAHIDDYARTQLGVRIATRLATAGMDAGVAAYGKLAAGTYDPIRARIAVEIGGSEALLWEAGDTDAMRTTLDYLNCRVQSIAGGTNEMQRNAIGERDLGLAREPSFDTNRPFIEVLKASRNWNGQVG
jgi:alkylation response protein AidB-like acyl-CoA dehydrogenase